LNNTLQLLAKFEKVALDAPLGEQGAEVLEQLERVAKLCTELKEFYKTALSEDPGCVPGWTLRAGANRRVLGDPAKVWDRVSDTLSSEQFMTAITIKVLSLQEIWAKAAGVPATKARGAFDELLGELVQTWPNAPTLIRTK
jgi:hypothetical protein